MTTIAYANGVLAGDACSWSGPCRRRVRKVFHVPAKGCRGFLVGFAGDGTFAISVLAWMRGQAERPNCHDFIKPDDLQMQCAIVIDERHRIWGLNYALRYTPSLERIFAFGAGHEFAWGALEAGATAAQAVRIAIKRSDYAGMGVHTVRFV